MLPDDNDTAARVVAKAVYGSAIFLAVMVFAAYQIYRVNTPWPIRAACEAIYSELRCVEMYYGAAIR